jgi:lysophospholipase-3
MYFRELRQLIETMYADNDNTKVTITAFSFGAQISLYFLNTLVSQEWKDTYIHSFVTLGGSWYAGVGIIFTLLSGPLQPEFLETQIGIPRVLSIYRNNPGFYATLPRASVWDDTVLIRTPNQNYTAHDYEQLFADAGFPDGYSQFLDSESGIDLSAPNVTTYCFYGSAVPTPLTFLYNNELNMTSGSTFGDGDGRINLQDLEVCNRWDGKNGGYTFNSTIFPGVNHPGMIRNEAVLQSVESIVRIQVSGAVTTLPNLWLFHIAMFVSILSFVKTIFY